MKKEEFQNPKEGKKFMDFETKEEIVGPKGLGKKQSVFRKDIRKN